MAEGLAVTRLQQRMAKLRVATGGSSNTGCMTDEVCWLLHGLIRHARPEMVIQTGHLWGKSALVVLDALKEEPLDASQGDGDYMAFVGEHSPPPAKGVLHSVDPDPLGVENWVAGVNLLEEWYPGRFRFHPQPSVEFFAELEGWPSRIFGIVDGDHSVDGAKRDLYSLGAMGAQTIFLDDTSWIPHLGDCAHGANLDGYAITEFPEYNGVTLLQRIR